MDWASLCGDQQNSRRRHRRLDAELEHGVVEFEVKVFAEVVNEARDGAASGWTLSEAEAEAMQAHVMDRMQANIKDTMFHSAHASVKEASEHASFDKGAATAEAIRPWVAPTARPSTSPTASTGAPTEATAPTAAPTKAPSAAPTTKVPTSAPSATPAAAGPAAAAAAKEAKEAEKADAASNAVVIGAIAGGVVLLAVAAGCWRHHKGAHPHHHRKYHRRASVRSAKMGVEMGEDVHQPHARRSNPADADDDDDVAEQMMNPMMAARAGGKKGVTRNKSIKLDSWVKQRNKAHRQNSQILIRQPSKGESELTVPPHLDHGHTPSHRKNYRKNHRGDHIKVKAADGTGHWHMAKDPNSGKDYWYNEETKKSSWTDPTTRGQTPDEGIHAALENLASGSRAGDASPAAAAAAGDWQKLTDNSSGTPRVYYWCKKTGETRWDEPPTHKHVPSHRKAQVRDHMDRPITVKGDDGGNWTKAKDEKSGKTYWYNEATGKSSWSDPHATAAGDSAASALPKGDRASHRKNFRLNHRGSAIQVKDSSGDKWTMASDPASGRAYWYNLTTGASSWTDPHESNASYAQPELQ